MAKKKFEYEIITLDVYTNDFNEKDYLNKMGNEGWELIGVTTKTNGKPILYLKRKVSDKTKPKKEVYVQKEILPRDAIKSRVIQIIVDKLGVDVEEVKEEASFRDDLGADSLDGIELIMEFESAFNVEIKDEDAQAVVTLENAIDLLYYLTNQKK